MAVTGTARTFGLLASIVRTVASVIGGLIIVHAVFVLFGANTHNVLVQFTAGIRDSFGWFTKNLFQPSDKKMAEAINDALAGFIWVFLGSLAAKLFARLAPASAGKDKDKASKKKDDTPRSTPVQKSQPEKPKDEPKQEAPKQEAAEQEAPKLDPKPQQEQPKDEASKDAAPKDDRPKNAAPKDEAPGDKAPRDKAPKYDEPKDEAPKERPAPDPEEESSAKHQAKDTARDEERADEPAGDKAQA